MRRSTLSAIMLSAVLTLSGCETTSRPDTAPKSFTLEFVPGAPALFPWHKPILDKVAASYRRNPKQVIGMAHFATEESMLSGLDETIIRANDVRRYPKKKHGIRERQIVDVGAHYAASADKRFKPNPLMASPNPVIELRLITGDCRAEFRNPPQE